MAKPARVSAPKPAFTGVSQTSVQRMTNVKQISLNASDLRLVRGLKSSGERLVRYQTPKISLFNKRGDYLRAVRASTLPVIPSQGVPVYNLGRNGLKVVVMSGRRLVLDPVELGISSERSLKETCLTKMQRGETSNSGSAATFNGYGSC